jgi:hypothetical protein
MKHMLKAVIFALGLLLCSATVRGTAPSIANSGAQHAQNKTAATNTVLVGLPGNVTAGNMILVFVGAQDSGRSTINTPTMTGETFVHLTNASNNGVSNAGQIQCYYVASAVGGQNTVTATDTGTANDMHILVIEITGQSTSSPIDASGNAHALANSSGQGTASTSGATTNATDLVIGAVLDFFNGGFTLTAAGYTLVDSSDLGALNSQAADFQKTVSSTGTQSATFGGFTLNDDLVMGIVAVQNPAAAGTVGSKVAGPAKLGGPAKVQR